MGDINDITSELQKISKKLNEEALIDVLKESSGQSDIKLKSYTTRNHSTVGDSFMSNVVFMELQGVSPKSGKTNSTAVVLKAMPPNICRRKTFRLPQFYKNEVIFYSKVFAKLMDFQKKKKPKIPFAEIPRFYKANIDGENDYVILEDFSIHGFKKFDRQKCFNFQHCEKVLKCLARFHALSFAMKDQKPEEFEELANSLHEPYYKAEKKDWNGGVVKLTLDASYEAISKEYPNSVYKDKMREFYNSPVYDKAVDCMKPTNPHAVIINGDSWAQNYLFLYENNDETSPKDVRMIDFQMSCCANPVCDISFLLYSCTDKQFRETNVSDLLRVYHQTLSDFIQELGSDPNTIYPYSTFEKEMKQYSALGFIMSMEAVAFTMLEDDETPQMHLMEGEEPIPLHKILVLPKIKDKSKRQRLADNIIYAIENGHI